MKSPQWQDFGSLLFPQCQEQCRERELECSSHVLSERAGRGIGPYSTAARNIPFWTRRQSIYFATYFFSDFFRSQDSGFPNFFTDFLPQRFSQFTDQPWKAVRQCAKMWRITSDSFSGIGLDSMLGQVGKAYWKVTIKHLYCVTFAEMWFGILQ